MDSDSNSHDGNDANDHSVIKYTRVTDVLTPFSGLDKAPPDKVENAAQRGKRVHSACEAIIKGLDALEWEEDIQPYMYSFTQWWDDKPCKIVAIEKRFFCDEYALTGQVDMIIEDDHGLGILDLKTSYSPSRTWPLQGSAYKYLATRNGYPIKTIKFLHLSREGKFPRIHIYEDQWDMYKKCLEVYGYFHPRKRNESTRKNSGVLTAYARDTE